jgi:hypothetical protein
MADPSSYRPSPGQIPVSPGVYKFRAERRRVIYVSSDEQTSELEPQRTK